MATAVLLPLPVLRQAAKSTLAEHLAERLQKQGHVAKVVPMDGFHLHNQILLDRGTVVTQGGSGDLRCRRVRLSGQETDGETGDFLPGL